MFIKKLNFRLIFLILLFGNLVGNISSEIIILSQATSNIDEYHNPKGEFPQKFHINGNKILDESDNQVIFRGLCAVDPIIQHELTEIQGGYCYEWGKEYYSQIKNWNATIIRLSIHPGSWRTYGVTKCLKILDDTLNLCHELELYVYLDFHSIGFPPTEEYSSEWDSFMTNKTEILSFWDNISEHFVDNNVVVMYELFNEPVYPNMETGWNDVHTAAWEDWKTFVHSVIDVIRENDPDSICMVGGLQWAYDLTYANLSPIERPNIVYSTHPYPEANALFSWNSSFGILSSFYPVFATEFGFYEDSPDYDLLHEESKH